MEEKEGIEKEITGSKEVKPKAARKPRVKKEIVPEQEKVNQPVESGAKPENKVEQPPAEIKPYPFPEAIKKARESSDKRKFSQTWDLIINVKGMDLKRPENRFSVDFILPAGRGKPSRIGVIADSLAAEAQKLGADIVIRRADIENLAKNKKEMKKIANDVNWFFGEVSLMAQIGKSFGTILGPRGKIPRPIPPKADLGAMIKNARNSIRISLKESPVISVPVGTEDMKDEDILKNAEAVYGFVSQKLPKGINNIRGMHIKLTMGIPVRLEVK